MFPKEFLEKVKNWTLEWDNAAVKYPRLLVKPGELAETIERIKAAKPGDYGLSVSNPTNALPAIVTPEANAKAVSDFADGVLSFVRNIVERGGAKLLWRRRGWLARTGQGPQL